MSTEKSNGRAGEYLYESIGNDAIVVYELAGNIHIAELSFRWGLGYVLKHEDASRDVIFGYIHKSDRVEYINGSFFTFLGTKNMLKEMMEVIR